MDHQRCGNAQIDRGRLWRTRTYHRPSSRRHPAVEWGPGLHFCITPSSHGMPALSVPGEHADFCQVNTHRNACIASTHRVNAWPINIHKLIRVVSPISKHCSMRATRTHAHMHSRTHEKVTWGVVRTMAPRNLSWVCCLTRSITAMCSSEVPGGVSMIRASRPPQSTWLRNCSIMVFLRGPRHITAALLFGRRNPIDMTNRRPPPDDEDPTSATTGNQPPGHCWICRTRRIGHLALSLFWVSELPEVRPKNLEHDTPRYCQRWMAS